MSLPKRLRAARAEAGMSQRDLAVAAGLSPTYVHLVERAASRSLDQSSTIKNPSLFAIRKLARVLGVRAEWLAFGSGEPREKGAA